ncbi:MAG: hypothetical protein ACC628_23540 [Pirellulaceae bacterium]
MGVQACYRSPRLYDTDGTKTLVMTWVDWFKEGHAVPAHIQEAFFDRVLKHVKFQPAEVGK